MSAPRVADFLGHIVESIEYLESFVTMTSEEELRNNRMHLNNAVRELEKIGEAANYIAKQDPSFAAAHPAIPWKELYGVRIILAHKYWKVDPAIIWQAMTVDLPPIKKVILAIDLTGLTSTAPDIE